MTDYVVGKACPHGDGGIMQLRITDWGRGVIECSKNSCYHWRFETRQEESERTGMQILDFDPAIVPGMACPSGDGGIIAEVNH